ncbi:MAG: hypothetical protein ACOCUC_01115, partial [bacterium]
YYPSYRAIHSDMDLWFHLSYGRHYVENLTFYIDHSMFSWTPSSAESTYNTWLGSSAMYLLHGVFGVTGLFALHYLILLASGAVVFLFARSVNVRPGIGVLAVILFAAISMRVAANFVKPEMFSTLFMSLTAALYLRFRTSPGRWIMWALPAVFLVWVNTHGLWQFGFTFLGLVFGVELVVFFAFPGQALGRTAMKYLALTVLFSFLALCMNPHGPGVPFGFVKGRASQIFSILFSSGGGASGGAVLDYYRAISEYQSMWPHLFNWEDSHFKTVSALCMSSMIAIFAGAWIFSWKRAGKADLPVAAANFFFFFMAMFMLRLGLVFGIIWIFSMVFLAGRIGPGSVFRGSVPLVTAAYLVLVAYTAVAAFCIYDDPSWFGKGYRNYIPDQEVNYIMKYDLPGPMFNDYISGGYLMWAAYPEYKVFLDPRQFPYRHEVFPDYQSIGSKYPYTPEGLEKFTDKYPAKAALIHRRYPKFIEWFQKSPEWTLAYFDRVGVVMIRKDVIPELSKEAKEQAMRGPGKYSGVSNPLVLQHLFNIYNNFISPRYARQVRDMFEKNVPDWYLKKDTALEEFDKALKAAEKRKQGQGQ